MPAKTAFDEPLLALAASREPRATTSSSTTTTCTRSTVSSPSQGRRAPVELRTACNFLSTSLTGSTCSWFREPACDAQQATCARSDYRDNVRAGCPLKRRLRCCFT